MLFALGPPQTECPDLTSKRLDIRESAYIIHTLLFPRRLLISSFISEGDSQLIYIIIIIIIIIIITIFIKKDS